MRRAKQIEGELGVTSGDHLDRLVARLQKNPVAVITHRVSFAGIYGRRESVDSILEERARTLFVAQPEEVCTSRLEQGLVLSEL